MRRRIALTLYELALGAEGWQNNPALRQPDHTAAIFVMKTQGGWSEKTELAVEFTVIREAVAALEKAGLDPNTEFARMIQDAHATRNAADGGVPVEEVKVEIDKMLARKRIVDGNGGLQWTRQQRTSRLTREEWDAQFDARTCNRDRLNVYDARERQSRCIRLWQ